MINLDIPEASASQTHLSFWMSYWYKIIFSLPDPHYYLRPLASSAPQLVGVAVVLSLGLLSLNTGHEASYRISIVHLEVDFARLRTTCRKLLVRNQPPQFPF